MGTDGLLPPLGEMVRKVDPDRYFTALFAGPSRRDALFTLYAFNHELARAREVVREPFAALIRLQWWREVVEGAHRRHEVAAPLRDALDAGFLDPGDLEGMIAGREAEADSFETLAAFEAYAMAAGGGVMVAAARALGMAQPELLRPWGAAYATAGILRSVPAHAAQSRCLLPLDMLREAGLSANAVIAEPRSAALAPVTAHLRSRAGTWLAASVPIPPGARAAALPAVFARRDLRRTGPAPIRPIWDKLAATLANFTGRLQPSPK